MSPHYLFVNLILPQHSNFVEILDVLISPTQIFFITDYFGVFKLKHFCRTLQETETRRVFKQLCQAVFDCHSYGVFLGDLDGSKIFITPSEGLLKIRTFAKAQYRPEMAQRARPDFNPGSLQMQLRTLPASTSDPVSDDVQALGGILLQMLSGQPLRSLPAASSRAFEDIVRNSHRPRIERLDPTKGAMHLLSLIGPQPFCLAPPDPTFNACSILAHSWLSETPLGLPLWSSPQYQSWLEQQIVQLFRQAGLPGPLGCLRSIHTIRFQVLSCPGAIQTLYTTMTPFQTGGSPVRRSFFVVPDGASSRALLKILPVISSQGIGTSREECKALVVFYTIAMTWLRLLPPHAHVARMLSFTVDRNTIYFLQELLCPTLRMVQFIQKADEKACRIVFRQMVQTLCFLHRFGLVFVILKPGAFAFADSSAADCKLVTLTGCLYVPQIATARFEGFESDAFFPSAWWAHMTADRIRACLQKEVSALGRILRAMVVNKWEDASAAPGGLQGLQNGWSSQGLDLLAQMGPHPQLTVEQILQHQWFSLA